MAKIYVASSSRNVFQPLVVEILRLVGHEVYDFMNPAPDNPAFRWSEIDPGWARWTKHEQLAALNHPRSVEHFGLDWAAMHWADTVVMVNPCGRSAHLELGWFCGAQKRTCALMLGPCEPELMLKMVDFIATDIQAVVDWLDKGDK